MTMASPGGTAGRPILQAIDSQPCDDVVVVVTRWYGGIKLGTGGLARAYGGTAAECLRCAPRVPIVQRTRCHVRCTRADFDAIESLLQLAQGVLSGRQFGLAEVTFEVMLPTAQVDRVMQRVTDISRGRAVLHGASLVSTAPGHDSP